MKNVVMSLLVMQPVKQLCRAGQRMRITNILTLIKSINKSYSSCIVAVLAYDAV